MVLGPDQKSLQASQALHELMLAHSASARHVVPSVLKKDQLDRGILASPVIRITKAHPETCSLDHNIWLLGWGSRCISSPSMPRGCHCHTLPVGHQSVANIRWGRLPVVGIEPNVFLSNGQSACDAAPVRRDSYSASDVGDVPTRLVVKYLDTKTGRVTRAGHSVAETLSASLRVCGKERKVSGLTSVTAGTRGMPFTHTLPVTLAAPGASQGTRAGPAGGEIHEADGALVALGSGEARPTYAMSSSEASMSQFVILGIIESLARP